jgi:hypothetical protein
MVGKRVLTSKIEWFMSKLELTDLSLIELTTIDGGLEKPLAYYLGYAIGYAAGEVTTLLAGISAGFKGE